MNPCLINLKASRKALVTFAVLLFVALILTVYTACAHLVASKVFEWNEVLWWPTSGYSFLPWPKMASGIVYFLTVPLNQVDQQYYQYVIQPGVLIVLTLLSWLVVVWKIWQIKKTR